MSRGQAPTFGTLVVAILLLDAVTAVKAWEDVTRVDLLNPWFRRSWL